ncbi:DMT family transporter [Xinfangfangia sp. CPCC 101601]|uniref:DMT family transporter n=1 Tax=Pseudogemmobacter lacusdianii TaxID=3069608 RepID=A0ABU0VWP1_9RHOB|nr:DMT family transporter [Xinfangfangia sp. CPCC 101601]MDQ2066186.1 DMT family transporter [Xinfangfangia sp. CPCC 101601]
MALSENLRGILAMSLSMAAFTINDTLMKSVTSAMPLFQAIALRGGFAILGLIVIARANGAFRQSLSRKDTVLTGLRSLAEVFATYFFLTALMHMPLANLSAIMQVLPLAVTLGAAVVFGDRIGWRRMLAILVGLVGVLIIIRPGTDNFDRYALFGLASVASVVVRDLAARRISAEVSSSLVALAAAVAVTVMGGVVTLGQGWVPVTGSGMAHVLGASAFLIVGTICSVTAMRHGDIGIVSPFRYTALLWAIVLGYLIFGSLPDGWTLIGATIVVAAGLFTLLRERRLRAAAMASKRV